MMSQRRPPFPTNQASLGSAGEPVMWPSKPTPRQLPLNASTVGSGCGTPHAPTMTKAAIPRAANLIIRRTSLAAGTVLRSLQVSRLHLPLLRFATPGGAVGASPGLDNPHCSGIVRSFDRHRSIDRPALRRPAFVGRFEMAYEIEGRLLEVCTCNVLCPCWVGEDPDFKTCDTVIACGIEQGSIEGVNVDGLTMAVSAHIPKNILIPKSWKAVVFVDERATAEQEGVLLKLFTGQLGGAIADLAGLI